MINDIRHIRAFLAVAKHSNFTRAAQELHISQSALTVQIQQIEEALGVKLLDRNKRRVALTDAGRQVLLPLQRIVIDSEAIVSQTREIAGLRKGIVSIALLPSIASGILSEVIRRFATTYPGILININDVVATRIIEQVRNEDVDFGIGIMTRPHRDLTATPLFTDRLFAFLPARHPLSSRAAVSLVQLSEYPLVLTAMDSSVRALLEDAMQKFSLQVTPAFEVNYMSTALSLIRAGFGVGVLPEHADAMGSASHIVKLPITRPAITRRIQIIRRKGKTPSPAASRMMELFEQVAQAVLESTPETTSHRSK
jgi:DNA-binding transcriptional LysR family regulator